MNKKQNISVIGIGNFYRGDDVIGLIIAGKIRARKLYGIDVYEINGSKTEIIELLNKYNHIIIVDAVCSGAKPGTIFRFEAHRENISSELFHYSTHSIGIVESIMLCHLLLNKSPKILLVYGIEGSNFSIGSAMSENVKAAVGTVTESIIKDIVDIRKNLGFI